MKKIVLLNLILFMIVFLAGNVYAASCTMDLKPSKAEVKKGEDFTVDIILKNIDAERGIIALGATIDYDRNNLEYVNIEGQGNWTKPSYNDANGKFAVDRNDGYATTEETIAKVTFKAKENMNVEETKIVLKEITSSNGVIDISASDVTTNVKISSPNGGSGNNQGDSNNPNSGNNNQGGNGNSGNNSDNNNSGNSNNGDSNTKNDSNSNKNTSIKNNSNTNKTISANTSDNLKNGVLPKAGTTSIVLGVILLVIAVSLIIYSRIRMIDKGTSGRM